MKSSKLIVTSTLIAAGLAAATSAGAKPGTSNDHHPTNHGQAVSAAAHANTSGSTNHGKTVSEVARDKSTISTSTSTHHYGYHTTTRSSTRSTQIRNALHIRNLSVQTAQRTYAQRRARILNDGDRGDALTIRQRHELADALEDRNRSIRRAQDQYNLTVRRVS